MKTLWIKVWLGACTLALVVPLATAAEQPAEGNVAGTGSVEIKHLPEVMRVHVEVIARGKDLKDALAKLKDRKEAARASLTALGASKEAIEFSAATVTSDKTDQQMQMERMLRERVSRGKKPAAKDQPAPPAVVSSMLKVDVPLKATSVEEVLVKSQALRDKIKAADLSGIKDMEKLSPKEEELAEEMEDMGNRFGYQEGPKRGEPYFTFVARITEEERAKALAEAFQKAKKDAGRLARAAGMDLGPLVQISKNPAAVNFDVEDSYPGRYRSPYYARYGRTPAGSDEDWPGEALGTEAGMVSLRISISTYFGLKAPSK
jgi:Protein of unknown function (DUF541)